MVSLGTALVLVFLILPNPFRVPNNNPTASAEYAPVPGKQESAQDANFGETGQASSGGIGAGGQDEGFLPGTPFKPPPQFKPRQKPCFDDPPRQTEDPLAPPCVPFFSGDNGGKTYKQGVTKDEITVLLYNDLDGVGDMTQPWKPSDEPRDHQAMYEKTYIVRTIKAQLRYFQERYQTYGRRVKVIAVKSQAGITTPCAQRRGEAFYADDHKAFAVLHLGDGGQCFLEEVANRFQITGFGLNSDVPRANYDRYKPYVWGFFPDQESEAAWSASFLCRVVVGDDRRPARFSTDRALRELPRKLGFIRPRNETDSQRGPENFQLAELLKRELKKQCGIEFDGERHLEAKYAETGAGTGKEAVQVMTNFKQRGVTTIICYCVPVPSELAVSKFQQAATQLEYYPEWYWDHASRMFRAIWNQRYADQSGRHRSFGVSHHWRQPAFKQQYHYQAYLAEEPGTTPNTRFNFDIYHLFLNLFQGIQAAGPNLTPETIQRGMYTFAYTNRDDPYVPTGGYGDYGPHAVSDQTWVDTAMGFWWDPDGTPPGGVAGEGCLRVWLEGRRFFTGTWPTTDQGLFDNDDAPCTQDDTEIDPAA